MALAEFAGDELTDRLREAITNGTFEPNQRLIEEDIARRLGSTRAAVRMAMARLEQEGLIVRERNRGARVRLVSEEEAVEILEARAALEAIVARYAAMNATAAGVATLRDIMQRSRAALAANDLIAFAYLHAEFHATLPHIAGHGTAMRLLALLRSQSVRFQYRQHFQPGRAEHSEDEHTALVDAIARRDADAAEAAMHAHMVNAIEALKESIEARHHRS